MNKAYFKKLLFMLILSIAAVLLTSGLRCSSHILHNLNIDIAQLDNSYLKLIGDYQKLLRQRNAYLKVMYMNANKSVDYLNILTDKLIEVGTKIYQRRKAFCKYL